jgi:uncharacterized protein
LRSRLDGSCLNRLEGRSESLSSCLMLECVHSMTMKGFHRKRSIAFWLLLALLLFVPVRAALGEAANSLHKPTDYVNDYAHVLSPQGATRLDRICMELNHSQANAQVAIVTIHSLDGRDAAEYASELEDKWKIGKKGSDRGVLVLLAVDDHKWRIDVGYGLEGILNDAKIGDIGRSMAPYLRAKDYDNAVLLVVGQLAQVIATDAHITLTGEPALPPKPASPKSSRGHTPLPILVILVLLITVFPLFILFLFVGTILRAVHGGGGFRTVGGGGDNDSSGGGSSGGSSGSSDSGSSSDSGVSDGGSFGGGGAGGSW